MFPRERQLTDRVTFLYGAARVLGASVEDLAGTAAAHRLHVEAETPGADRG